MTSGSGADPSPEVLGHEGNELPSRTPDSREPSAVPGTKAGVLPPLPQARGPCSRGGVSRSLCPGGRSTAAVGQLLPPDGGEALGTAHSRDRPSEGQAERSPNCERVGRLLAHHGELMCLPGACGRAGIWGKGSSWKQLREGCRDDVILDFGRALRPTTAVLVREKQGDAHNTAERGGRRPLVTSTGRTPGWGVLGKVGVPA